MHHYFMLEYCVICIPFHYDKMKRFLNSNISVHTCITSDVDFILFFKKQIQHRNIIPHLTIIIFDIVI